MSIDDPVLRLLLSIEPNPDDGSADAGVESLLTAIQLGDRDALKRLLKQYLRVVIFLVRESGPIVSKDQYLELIQAGNMGVVCAASEYDPEQDFPKIVRARIKSKISEARAA